MFHPGDRAGAKNKPVFYFRYTAFTEIVGPGKTQTGFSFLFVYAIQTGAGLTSRLCRDFQLERCMENPVFG